MKKVYLNMRNDVPFTLLKIMGNLVDAQREFQWNDFETQELLSSTWKEIKDYVVSNGDKGFYQDSIQSLFDRIGNKTDYFSDKEC